MQSGMQSQDSTVLLSATARHFSRARARIYKRKRFGADRTELWSCVKVVVASFGSLSLKSLMVSVDVKQHLKKKTKRIEQSSGAV